MADYSFQPRFVVPIELGIKQQTIRAYRKPAVKRWRTGADGASLLAGHAKVGGPVRLKTGPRFQPRIIGEATAVLVDQVRLDFRKDQVATLGKHGLTTISGGELDPFAVRDGFQDWADLRAFWRDMHGLEPFEGARIFWGDTFKGPLDR